MEEMKTKIEIKSIWGNLLFEYECENNSKYLTILEAVKRSANLSGADLSGADLRSADLRSANLSGADLSGADLSGADLRSANLSGADLSGADLRSADLRSADLRSANLRSANLSGADLRSADLRSAEINENTGFFGINCPEEGSFIAFKKASGKIIKLMITETAKRSSATSLKCRASEARVISFENLDGSICNLTEISSNYDSKFVYRIGETVSVENFDEDRWNECSAGIHFFMSKEQARQYN